MELVRVRPDNGETYRTYQNRSGKYVLADPKFGNKKHLQINAVYVDSLTEAANLVRQGFHLWMKGDETGQQNLIAPQNIEFR